jgi:hypothetical protein
MYSSGAARRESSPDGIAERAFPRETSRGVRFETNEKGKREEEVEVAPDSRVISRDGSTTQRNAFDVHARAALPIASMTNEI